MQENNLIIKLRLIPKFMLLQTAKQIISIHILRNISKSKGNETIIFRQLIEHITRTIFLENSYANGGGETSPRSFFKLL